MVEKQLINEQSFSIEDFLYKHPVSLEDIEEFKKQLNSPLKLDNLDLITQQMMVAISRLKEEEFWELVDMVNNQGVQDSPKLRGFFGLLWLYTGDIKYKSKCRFTEEDYKRELEEKRKLTEIHLKEFLCDCQQGSDFGTIEKWINALTTFHKMTEKERDWDALYELSRQMPEGLDRQQGVIDERLREDIDSVFKELYGEDGYNEYVELQKRKVMLIHWGSDPTIEEREELNQIGDKLARYSLKSIYMEMRRLGYTSKDLGIYLSGMEKVDREINLKSYTVLSSFIIKLRNLLKLILKNIHIRS